MSWLAARCYCYKEIQSVQFCVRKRGRVWIYFSIHVRVRNTCLLFFFFFLPFISPRTWSVGCSSWLAFGSGLVYILISCWSCLWICTCTAYGGMERGHYCCRYHRHHHLLFNCSSLEALDNRRSLISELHDIMTDKLGRLADQTGQGSLLEAASLDYICTRAIKLE